MKIATRQIIEFIEQSKKINVGDKHILDYVKENVKLQAKANEYDAFIEKIENKLKELNKPEILENSLYKYKLKSLNDFLQELLDIDRQES